MNVFKLAKAVVSKQMGIVQVDASADKGLPYGARIGSVVTLKTNPFLRAQGSLVGLPQPFQSVVGVSRLHVELNGQAYRLYTALGDDDSGLKSFLQIYTDANTAVLEVVYFRRMTRLIPQSTQEQDAFLGEHPDGLGQLTFSIQKAQMQHLDLGAGVVETAFGGDEEIVYDRAVGGGNSNFVAPFKGFENRIENAAGSKGLHQDITFMPYQRTLAGGATEQLLISTEVVSDRNGDENAREIHVDFMVGLVLNANDFLVQ